jgi:hypothetical protein
MLAPSSRLGSMKWFQPQADLALKYAETGEYFDDDDA